MFPHFIPSPHSPTKPSKRRCGTSPRARVLTPDNLLTDLIIHHDLTPRDLMHSLPFVTAQVVLPLDKAQRSSHQPSQREAEAVTPRNLPRNLPLSACLNILCGLTIPFTSASAGWLAGPLRQVPQGEPWRRFLLNRRSMAGMKYTHSWHVLQVDQSVLQTNCLLRSSLRVGTNCNSRTFKRPCV